MFIYLDHERYELAISKVDHTQVYRDKWICELSYYVLGYGNVDSIAHEHFLNLERSVSRSGVRVRKCSTLHTIICLIEHVAVTRMT